MEIETKFLSRGLLACACLFAGLNAWAAPVSPAVRTILLDPDEDMSSASSIAYHPGFGRYYGSNTGGTSQPAWSFGAGGGAFIQETAPLNIDARGWFYNPNTGQLEVSSYNACCDADPERGLIAPGVDGSGNLTGGTTNILAPPLAGIADDQSAPAYNPVADVIYSRGSTDTVNVADRADGSLVTTIVLDVPAAGASSVPSDGVVFVPEENWLGVLDQDNDDVLVFDLAGDFVARIELDIDVTDASRRPGYANGQLFVYDEIRDVWQGYRISDLVAAEESVPVPTWSTWATWLSIMMLGLLGAMSLRQRALNRHS